MRKALLSILIMLLVSSNYGFAQSRITGKVTSSSDGSPLEFVSVFVKGTTLAVSTGEDGSYSINVSQGSTTLVFSFIGFQTIEVEIANRSVIDVVMRDDANFLEEVIITGYGIFSRPEYTGSASVLNTRSIRDIPVVSVTQMLEGNVSGVTISTTSGQPGSTQSFRIRGMGSLNASNEPLYVLDGVPVLSSNMSNDVNSSGGLSMLATLNPSDIENITVLKDAASTSMYGARGSNGIVLITTKKGREGKMNVTFRSSWGSSDLAYTFREIMGGEERRALIYEGYVNQQLIAGRTEGEAKAYADERIDLYASKPLSGYADWIGAMFHKGNQQNYEISALGGASGNNYAISLGYTKSDGISLVSDLERFTGRFNYGAKYKNVDFNASSLFSLTENKKTPEGSYYASAMYSSRLELTPSIPIYKEDGTYNTGFSKNGGYNPLNEVANSEYFTRVGRANNTLVAGWNIWNGIRLQSTFNIDYSLTKEFRYWGPEAYDGRSQNGQGRLGFYENMRYTSSTLLSYNKTFNKHSINAAAAYEAMQTTYEGNIGTARGYGQQINTTLSNASTPVSISQPKTRDAMVSYVARANYGYDNRYTLAATFRRDGSSRLAPASRWDNFFSFSGSWRVTGEEFMQSIKDIVSDLKLRASYGVTGNVPDGLYSYFGTYNTAYSYANLSAIRENNIPNYRLKWERGYQTDIGFELSLFKNLMFIFDVYQRDTKDLLMSRPLSNMSGFSSMTDNVGQLQNRGWELEVKSVNISKKDFYWSTSLNLSSNKNKIVKLSDLSEYVDGRYMRREGALFSSFYLREYAGVDPQTGVALYYINQKLDNGKYSRELTENPDNAFPVLLNDAQPVLVGGLNNTINYKFIDLSFNLSFSLGGYSYDNGMYALQDDGRDASTNKSTELRRRWMKPGDNTDIPRYVSGNAWAGYYNSSRGIHSNDHIRLKHLTIGVNVPNKWISPVGLSKARVYFSGTNLLTLAAYSQWDPELIGTVGYGVPPLKTWTFGIEISL